MKGCGPHVDRLSRITLAVAATWSGGLMVAAATLPSYTSESVSSNVTNGVSATTVDTSSATLVQINGLWVLMLLAIPLVTVLIVTFVLRRRRILTRPGAGIVAWAMTTVLTAFCLLAILTVGIFVLPVAVLLAIACCRASDPQAVSLATS